ncbi:MAG: YegJ family protein [Planctomycetota bacterium]|jgi:uncharacterized protein YegJ (DUF2314 family)
MSVSHPNFVHAWCVAVALAVPALIGCSSEAPPADDVIRRDGEPPVFLVEEEDEAMTRAIDEARATIDRFIEALQAPSPTQNYFSVKAPFTDGEDREHIWLSGVSYDGTVFEGEIGNEPADLTSVKLGDRVAVAPDQITDWMIIDDGRLLGGYSIRLLRDRMTEAERREFDAGLPFVIE